MSGLMTSGSIAASLKKDLEENLTDAYNSHGFGFAYVKGEGEEILYSYDESGEIDAQHESWAFSTVHDLHEIIKTKGAAFVIKNMTKTAKLELIKAWLEDNEKPKRQILRGEIVQDEEGNN